MSEHERGAYTPPASDAPLAFDARQPVRGARPVPFTLIISIVVLAALVAAIFVFYRSGVRQAGDAPQTVGAPLEGLKAAAPAEAQPQDPAAGLQIYRSDETGQVETLPAEPAFVPPPEQPQPRPQPKVVVTPPVQTAQAPAAQPALRPALPAQPPAAAPAQKTAAPPAKAPALAPETKTAAATPAPAAKTTGGAVVQIGAVSSTALADKAWNEAVAAAPGLAAGKGKSVERIERNGAVLYRTAVTGFASREEAAAFCNRLKAAGKSCFVR